MDELIKRPGGNGNGNGDGEAHALDDEQKLQDAGIYLMKKMDLKPEDGGMIFPVVLPSELSPLDEVLTELALHDLVEINQRKERYQLTKQGLAHVGKLIDEAEALIDEFDEEDLADVVVELRARNLDVFRARFLWGWYEGEFDDLVVFQQRRGIKPVERLWAYYLLSDAFYDNLALEIEGDEPGGGGDDDDD
jgi:hypothetical protein